MNLIFRLIDWQWVEYGMFVSSPFADVAVPSHLHFGYTTIDEFFGSPARHSV